MSESNSIKITQSLIKSLLSVVQKNIKTGEYDECGLLFELKFIHKRWDLFLASDAMALGTWFEYMCTGSLPKDGKVPKEKKVAKPNADGNYLSEPYNRMLKHVENFKRFMKYYGLEIVSVGRTIKADDLEGTLDIEAKATKRIVQNGEVLLEEGDTVILDMKASGLLDDKWQDYGWHLDALADKSKLILQPIHYKFIGKYHNVFGKEVPFWFLLFNTKDENDFRCIDFRVTQRDFDLHVELIRKTITVLNHYLERGFPARPTMARCGDCPIKLKCKHFMAIPPIVKFELPTPPAIVE